MLSHLQAQIEKGRKERNLSINKLEILAGLGTNSVRFILEGKSKNPGIETLEKLAKILDCTMDDLTGYTGGKTEHHNLKSSSIKNPQTQWNEQLYIECIQAISKNLNDRNIILSFEQIIILAEDAYKYSIAKQTGVVDQDYIKWQVSKNF